MRNVQWSIVELNSFFKALTFNVLWRVPLSISYITFMLKVTLGTA